MYSVILKECLRDLSMIINAHHPSFKLLSKDVSSSLRFRLREEFVRHTQQVKRAGTPAYSPSPRPGCTMLEHVYHRMKGRATPRPFFFWQNAVGRSSPAPGRRPAWAWVHWTQEEVRKALPLFLASRDTGGREEGCCETEQYPNCPGGTCQLGVAMQLGAEKQFHGLPKHRPPVPTQSHPAPEQEVCSLQDGTWGR